MFGYTFLYISHQISGYENYIIRSILSNILFILAKFVFFEICPFFQMMNSSVILMLKTVACTPEDRNKIQVNVYNKNPVKTKIKQDL
jgi:hypothetical protein